MIAVTVAVLLPFAQLDRGAIVQPVAIVKRGPGTARRAAQGHTSSAGHLGPDPSPAPPASSAVAYGRGDRRALAVARVRRILLSTDNAFNDWPKIHGDR